MNVLCLMPTYGRTSELLANALACFEWQDYDRSRLRLTVFDDEGFLDRQTSPMGWNVSTMVERRRNLGRKYNEMVAGDNWADAFCVWDDDDIYLPWHVSSVVAALTSSPWAHPVNVWSTYTGRPELENAAGRFHGSLAVRKSCASWVDTLSADFDQQMLAKLAMTNGGPGRPDRDAPPSYVFRWADTGSHHCQAYMRSATDTTWWDAYAAEVAERRRRRNETRPGPLRPAFDQATVRVVSQLRERGLRL